MNIASKNWRQELINTKTDNYDLVVNLNLSTGCPQSMYALGKDSLLFINCFTPNVIKTLIDKSSSRVEFVNMKIQKDMKWDIYYHPKRNQEFQTNKDTLLKILGSKIKFSISSDSLLSKVYTLKIADPAKLKRRVDNYSKTTSTRLFKKKIEYYKSPLSSIFKDLESNLKIYIEYNMSDTNHYTMVVPKDNINNLISYFNNECGIELIEKEKKVEITKITFVE
jgi:hypothetical protein